MLGGKRSERVAELIRAELGQLLLMKLKDPGLGFVTITRVVVSADLRHARVWYSVMKSEAKAENTARAAGPGRSGQSADGGKFESALALERARGFLQHELATVLKLRLTPILIFEVDHSVDHSMKIESIIKQIHCDEDKKQTE